MLQNLPIATRPELQASAPVLETARLTLRVPTLADAAAIAAVAGDQRVAIHLRRIPHPYAIDDAVAFITGLLREGRETAFVIERAGEVIGLAGLDCTEPAAPELGYCLSPAHWGRGYATEAARAVIDYAFEETPADELRAGARVVNPASRRVLEKCGFQWTGVELHRFLALGSSTPVDCFRLDRGVWASLKSWSETRRR